MIDIRQVCKVFLEFVYDNYMLPEGIINILQNKKTQKGDTATWDFAEVMTILNKNINYDMTKIFKYDVVRNVKPSQQFCLDSFGRDKLEWLDKHTIGNSRNKFKDAIDYRNDFFHDVSTESGARSFCTLLQELIVDAPIDKAMKDGYVEKIEKLRTDNDEALKRHLKEKTEELDKLKEKNAQLQISLRQIRGEAIPINNEYDSLPDKEGIRNFWYEHLNLKLDFRNSKYANYGKAATHPEAYWASSRYEKLKTDWYFILRRDDQNTLKLIFVPANEISEKQVSIEENVTQRTEEQKQTEFDVFIRDDNYIEEHSELSFRKYVCAIADFNTMEITFPNFNE